MTRKKQIFDEYGFRIQHYNDPIKLDSREIRDPDTMVTTGNWVLIRKKIPVKTAPVTYGIYWAVPYRSRRACKSNDDIRDLVGVDEYGRQCALIYTPEEVKIFPDEYHILTEERLQEYRDAGWCLKETNVDSKQFLNLDIIEQGRHLCEEEREVIWALMLEGLSEQQACEEYFLTKHAQTENTGFCYILPPDLQEEMIRQFGE